MAAINIHSSAAAINNIEAARSAATKREENFKKIEKKMFEKIEKGSKIWRPTAALFLYSCALLPPKSPHNYWRKRCCKRCEAALIILLATVIVGGCWGGSSEEKGR